LASAYADTPLPTTTVAIGEVGLAGDLRRVSGMERRLTEAARQGFTTALIPPGCAAVPKGMRALESANIVGALQHLLRPADRRPEPPAPLYLVGHAARGAGTAHNDGR
jgi:DNA repair protein RadA/Sms